ncbi:endonuclease III [bacterium]|nr:endonuclease III [bacterium]
MVKPAPFKKTKEPLSQTRGRAVQIQQILAAEYPDVKTFLNHDSPFQLLIAVILSAQCTDERVNMVTPALFARFPTAECLAKADFDEVLPFIRSINFCNAKTANIIATSKRLVADFAGQVPVEMSDLISLAGVGRKTANVVRGQAFGLPGITVDTHVKRLSNRLGFAYGDDPTALETTLMSVWPESIWSPFSTELIVHGRRVCTALKPKCQSCILYKLCPSYPLNTAQSG